MVDGAPEVVLYAIDLHESLVEMPTAIPEIARCGSPVTSIFGGKDPAKTVPPEPHRLMCEVDATFRE